ncbi:MAG: DUF721 domain-containing protein [Phascolarctobacterium sp.]|nr:DUF721 domain-containing protein [Phascolarctobacterium sp.]
MSFQKISGTDEIIKKLFDSKANNKNIPLVAKRQFLLYYLEAHWEEICGEIVAQSSSPIKFIDNDLTIVVNNSMLANELFMMRGMFLAKVNKFLAGFVQVKNVYFKVGSLNKKSSVSSEKIEVIPKGICPKCGCKMDGRFALCSCCEREEKEKLKNSIYELLMLEPWLDYEDCKKYLKCDKILFASVKDNLKNRYFREVCLDIADDEGKLMAVMLLTGKSFAEVNERIYSNALAYIIRSAEGYKDVPTSGSRFYGEKQ